MTAQAERIERAASGDAREGRAALSVPVIGGTRDGDTWDFYGEPFASVALNTRDRASAEIYERRIVGALVSEGDPPVVRQLTIYVLRGYNPSETTVIGQLIRTGQMTAGEVI